MVNNDNLKFRKLLVRFLGGETHMSLDQAVNDFPMNRINEFPPNTNYTPWHLLEHIRITQNDIVDFMQNCNYQDKKWPDDYWPKRFKKANQKMWKNTINLIKKDIEVLEQIILDPNTDLNMTIPWGNGQTIVEEAIKVSDHNSYHIGEFAILRQVMSTWPKKLN